MAKRRGALRRQVASTRASGRRGVTPSLADCAHTALTARTASDGIGVTRTPRCQVPRAMPSSRLPSVMLVGPARPVEFRAAGPIPEMTGRPALFRAALFRAAERAHEFAARAPVHRTMHSSRLSLVVLAEPARSATLAVRTTVLANSQASASSLYTSASTSTPSMLTAVQWHATQVSDSALPVSG